MFSYAFTPPGGAAAKGKHGPVDLPGCQWWLWQRVGAVGAEAVQQEAEVSPPGVGCAGGVAGRQDAGVGPADKGEILQGEVGA